jgi:hypothetical protein
MRQWGFLSDHEAARLRSCSNCPEMSDSFWARDRRLSWASRARAAEKGGNTVDTQQNQWRIRSLSCTRLSAEMIFRSLGKVSGRP